MKILNIYGQYYWHTEARIMGNREGLLELKTAIERALLKEGKAFTTSDNILDNNGDTALFASDGEGYEVIVEMHNDEWGLKGGSNSFWNKEESNPQYIGLESARYEGKDSI